MKLAPKATRRTRRPRGLNFSRNCIFECLPSRVILSESLRGDFDSASARGQFLIFAAGLPERNGSPSALRNRKFINTGGRGQVPSRDSIRFEQRNFTRLTSSRNFTA